VDESHVSLLCAKEFSKDLGSRILEETAQVETGTRRRDLYFYRSDMYVLNTEVQGL
jgi:hypothetical protein